MALGLIGIFTSSAYAGTYENATFTISENICSEGTVIDFCVNNIES